MCSVQAKEEESWWTSWVLYSGALLWNRSLELIQDMWERDKAVEDWKNAVVVQKGDLKVCDGISLLDVVGRF